MQIFLLCSCYDPEVHPVGKNITFVQLQFPLAQVSSDFPKKKSSFGSSFFFLLQGAAV
jgi:hypothetical protein